jgi:hypothetical protein
VTPSDGSDDDFFAHIRMRDKLLGWSIIFVPIIVTFILLRVFHEPERIDPRNVFGCYASEQAPRLEIGANVIRIDQPDKLSLNYRVEAAKQGYDLHVDPDVAPIAVRDRYMFGRTMNGSSWPLLPSAYDDPRRLRHLKDFRGRFYVYARDGTQLNYYRIASAGACF